MANTRVESPFRSALGGSCAAKKHDTASAYSWHGCRCPEARADEARRRRERRRAQGMHAAAPTVPAQRYVRMLRELLDGRTYRDVADRLGWSTSRLSALLKARRVQRATAERIVELHRLLRKPAAAPATFRRTGVPKELAERPADPLLVQLAVGGEVPWEQLGLQDRSAVVHDLKRLGLSIRDSAARLRVSSRTVCRWRSADAAHVAPPTRR